MTDTTTYWVRAGSEFNAITYARGEEFRYESREAAERREPEPHKLTYEITITNHGPAPELTWWFAKWNTWEGWDVSKSVSKGEELWFGHEASQSSAMARVLATSEADARAKAIDAWREAGFLPVLERVGLEVD